jgi:toxin FitB
MYLLDSNIVSEVRRPRPHGGVVAWMQSLPPDQMFLSAFTLREIQAGLEHQRAKNPELAQALENWMVRIESTFTVLAMDGPAFKRHAQLMHGKSQALYEDALIAATAIRNGLIVATRNVRDFKTLGAKTYNPFDYRG